MSSHITLAAATFIGLAKRYLRCWQHAWARRAEMDREQLGPDEAEFLASALALQRTPVSPAPHAAIWLLMGFSLLALLWACLGQLDIVASASGKVIVSGNTKAIQALSTASIHEIHVREGDSVQAGQLLLVLDPTEPAADVHRLTSDLDVARLQALKARSVLNAIDHHQVPAFPVTDGLSPTKMQELVAQTHALHQEFRARQARLQADIDKRQAELQSTRMLIQKIESTLPYTQSRAQDYQQLSERHFMSRHAWMEKEQQRLEQEGELATQRSRETEIIAALREGREQRHALLTETRRLLLESESEGRQKSAALEQELLKAHSRLQLTQVRAPIDGTVQQLAVHTIGGVVTPAQVLMLLVPRQQVVEVEAMLENKDVGFVRPGQVAEIKLDAFPYTRYGTIPAIVEHISRDAVSDEKRGLLYLAKLRLEKNTVTVNAQRERLVPGMAVTAEVKTGKRAVIEYFLSPVMQYKDESLRER